MNDLKKRVEELTKILNEANYNYYVLDNPTITDQEYDKYLRELINIETEHPELADPASPTNRVGGEVIDKFNKIVHEKPMLSLANVFNEEEIKDFDAKIKKEGYTPEYVCEYKIDGLSVALIYEGGKLIRGVTRGDGVTGEDITHNVKTIKSIPLTLPRPIDIEVRGEIFMNKSTLEKLNKERSGLYIYNLGTGIGYSVIDIVNTFEKVTGQKVPYKIVERRAGDIAEFYANAEKAKNELGWIAEKTLEDMCRDSWNYITTKK